MDKMTIMDAGWLYGETSAMPFHVGGISIFPKPTKGSPYELIREQLAGQVDQFPLFHRVLDERSVAMGSPVWKNVSAANVDLGHHIKRVTIPQPGDLDTLRAFVTELHRELLDRRRPLWQIHVIEGLENDGFAVYTKLHHCVADGTSTTAALGSVFNSKDNGAAKKPPVDDEPELTLAELFWNNHVNFLSVPAKLAEAVPDALKGAVAGFSSGQLPRFSEIASALKPAPSTPFNIMLTPERRLGTISLSLPEVKRIGKLHSGTINDVVLAVCSGALRRYLHDLGQLPNDPLVGALPVSVRQAGDMSVSNQVSQMLVTLVTDVEDPIERIKAVQERIKPAKEMMKRATALTRVGISLPPMGIPAVFNRMSDMLERMAGGNRMPPMASVFISNVPGGGEPFECAGVNAQHSYPVSLLMHGIALNFTITGYVDKLEFGVLSCPAAVPDPQKIADLVGDEFRRLKEASKAS